MVQAKTPVATAKTAVPAAKDPLGDHAPRREGEAFNLPPPADGLYPFPSVLGRRVTRSPNPLERALGFKGTTLCDLRGNQARPVKEKQGFLRSSGLSDLRRRKRTH